MRFASRDSNESPFSVNRIESEAGLSPLGLKVAVRDEVFRTQVGSEIGSLVSHVSAVAPREVHGE